MSTFFAISSEQKLGLITVVLLTLGWAVFMFRHIRRPEAPPPGSEIELAANRRPYLDDEALEGPKLNRTLWSALAMLMLVAVFLPGYWLREPSRQEGAERGFDRRAAHRGFLLFQPADSPVPAGNVGHFGCGGCHGPVGEGGVTKYSLADPLNSAAPPRQVTWKAPALDTVLLRYSEDEVRSVLVYGRPNTPMPPWGVEGGGPMNDQQIDDLIAYLASIQRKPDEVKKENLEKYGTNGPSLFENFCARCHTKGWAYGESENPGGGAYGPALTAGATVRQFPAVDGKDSHAEFLSQGAEYQKPYGTRGVGGNEGGGMPGFGEMLTQEQILAIVQYERSL